MGKFCDSPYFIVKEFIENIDPYGTSFPKKAHLKGPSSGMVAKYGYGVDLFVKTEDGYLRIKGIPIANYPQDNIFRFQMGKDNYRASEITWNQLLENYAGYEVYFRKDALYHDYVNAVEPNWKDVINTNRIFLYFGTIYPATQDQFTVNYYGMKDFVVNALPSNNRTDNMVEFLQTSFDEVYNRPYYLIRNIFTQSDTHEVNQDYLYYISNMYASPILTPTIEDINRKRDYVDNLPSLLKRKGTYTSLYLIWKNIIGDNPNYLNIYERWHDPIPPSAGDNPYPYFVDHLYTTYPEYQSQPPTGGAGIGYYWSPAVTATGYPTYDYDTGMILSPHYKIEIDLTNAPFGDNYIIDKPFTDTLIRGWETMRPVSRVVHYQNVISPIGNFGLKPKSLYGSDYKAFCITRGLQLAALPISVTTAIVTKNGNSDVWIVTHNLHTANPVVQFFDNNKKQMYPDKIEYLSDDSIKVTWAIPVEGSAFLSVPDSTYTELAASASQWIVDHSLGKYNIIQIEDAIHSHFIPLTITATDDDTVTVNFLYNQDGILAMSDADYLYTSTGTDIIWNIHHNLSAFAIQVQCFDENDQVIYPADISIISSTQVDVTFSEPVSGHAVVKKIGSRIADMDGIVSDIDFLAVGDEGTAVDKTFNPAASGNALQHETARYPITVSYDDDYYYVKAEIPLTDEDMTITEMGLFHTENVSTEKTLWYTYNSPIYKSKDSYLTIFYRLQKVIS